MNKRSVEAIALMVMLALAGSLRGDQGSSKKVVREISSLIAADKVPEAVEKAKAAPGSVQDALWSVLKDFDDFVTTRKIDEAKGLVAAVRSFLDSLAPKGEGEIAIRQALEGRSMRLQGIELNDAKEYQAAEPVLRKALELSQAAKDEVLEAGIRNNLGYSLRNQSKLEEAAREFDAARKMAEAQKDNLRAGSYNFNLGNALLALGRDNPAFDAFKRSVEQNREAGRESLMARGTLMKGVVLSRINKVSEEPMKHFEDAQKVFATLGDDRNCGWCYYLMADHIAYRFKFAEAAALGEKAVSHLEKAKDRDGLIRCYTLLSDMYGRLQNKEKVAKYRRLARELSSKK
jgi:tetratricopeptide (TPR) repeat protein